MLPYAPRVWGLWRSTLGCTRQQRMLGPARLISGSDRPLSHRLAVHGCCPDAAQAQVLVNKFPQQVRDTQLDWALNVGGCRPEQNDGLGYRSGA